MNEDELLNSIDASEINTENYSNIYQGEKATPVFKKRKSFFISTPVNKNVKNRSNKWQLSPVKSIDDKCVDYSNHSVLNVEFKDTPQIDSKCYKIGPFEIKEINLSTLSDREWLDDIIVDSFIYSRTFSSLIAENHAKVTSLDSFFFVSLKNHGSNGPTMMKRGLDCNILKSDIVLAPVCNKDHWTLIVIDRSKRIITHLDSLQGKCNRVLQIFSDFILTLEKNFNTHCGTLSKWTFYKPKDIVLQSNTYDCGVHVCLYADIICNGKGKIPKGNLINKRDYIKSEILKSSELNLPRIENKISRDDLKNIITENNPIDIKTELPRTSSNIYLQNMVRKVFKTSRKICLLGPKCLKPKEEVNTMVFCDGCRDWYHKSCLNFMNEDYETILEDSNSFLCITCKK